jgi:hypothetical protein
MSADVILGIERDENRAGVQYRVVRGQPSCELPAGLLRGQA